MTVPESVSLIQSDNSESKKKNAKKKPGGAATARNVFLKFSYILKRKTETVLPISVVNQICMLPTLKSQAA